MAVQNSGAEEASEQSAGQGQSPRSFEGEHQPGVDANPQRIGLVVACDVQGSTHAELRELFKTLTERLRRLHAGGRIEPDGVVTPARDSGELGTDIDPEHLSITVGVGASLFDDRFGLADKKPAHLATMRPFPDDVLQSESCHGDLVLQICAHHEDTVTHALRDILRHTYGKLSLRWRQTGYQSPSRPTGTQRNHFGFKDGIVNPAEEEYDSLVWAGEGEPAWARGGSYMVVRLISLFTEFWDRISVAEQEQIFGRQKDTGGPLSGGEEEDAPNYAGDPVGDVIPIDSHIRLANPRTASTKGQLMLRRSYNYDNGVRDNGTLDLGLMFICFQQALERQFITVQRRLEGEPLADYFRTYGGGYFFILPGVRAGEDYLGRGLLEC